VARILIVDDDLAVCETFARMLRLGGHDVSTVDSPAEALERARQAPPDALILDMRMPGNGGLDFLRRLRAEDRIVLRYADNPNGSVDGIAGITNEAGNVVGLMPHPERASVALLGSTDGLVLLRSLLAAATASAAA